MTILLNGQPRPLPGGIRTIADLLSHYHLENKMIVVERNRQIVAKSAYSQEAIVSGDRIEIVHFVGGG
ncbi:MAG: sulfur carrier protein ThiS [Sporolactobacillus sp.]|jgi:sulfur carrier protein|nr:sulfur carrier protein ThiS [Sporolactobacillus sp.]